MKILVIDDSEDIRDLAEIVLGSDGSEVLLAEDGASGLDLALAHRPDLILLDVFMPGWSGEETLRTIRLRPELADIPVAFLTGESRPDEVKRLGRLGAIGLVEKPFTPSTLLASVRALLAGRQPEKDRDLDEGLLNPAVISELAELADDDQPEFLRDLVEAFASDAGSAITAMHSALVEQDRGRLSSLAHVLKSSSGNVGAAAMSRVAQQIEGSAAKAPFEELARDVNQLSGLLPPTSAALREAASKR